MCICKGSQGIWTGRDARSLSVIMRITVAKGCVVHGAWPEALAKHVRVLINPANDALIGPRRPAFPRGGPVPPQPPPGVDTSFRGWGGMDAGADMLYPAMTVDGLVHLQGGAELRAVLAATAPVLEERTNVEPLRCRVGQAVITSGAAGAASRGPSGLPFDAIVHTVPPFWPRRGDEAEREEWAAALLSCYTTSFGLARDYFAQSSGAAAGAGLAIATPVLGAGARGAPFAPAAHVLAEAALRFGAGRVEDAGLALPMAASLRVVVNAAGMSSEIAAMELALKEAAA